MRKPLLFASILAISALVANAQEQPAAQWGALMGGASGDQSTAIAIDSEGCPLWLSTAASTEAALDVFYQGKEVFQGALYNAGNSSNNNLALMRTAQDGSLDWTIYSTSGDYASGQGGIAVDKDGNIVFTVKVRHTDGMLDKQLNIIDAAGKTHEFGGAVDKRFYRIGVVKANSKGEVLWVKLIEASTAPAACASGTYAEFTPDAISSSALAVDGQGNIYLGGNYCSTIDIDGVKLEPVNVSAWTGDSQTACGNMFLIKLDADGKYVDSLVGDGEIAGYSILQGLEWNDGNLYIAGYAKGEGSFKFAGVSLSPSAILSPIVGKLGADLKADWVKCCPAEPVEDKNALQNIGITICGDNMWLCGLFNQKISDGDKFVAATQGKLREGFIIKFNKNTGEWLSSACSRVGFPDIVKLSGYLKMLQSPDHLDKAYAYGYVMDATIGVFLREYDAETLEPNTDHAWSIVTGGGVPTACAIAHDKESGCAYVTARGNKAFTLMSDPEITTDATKNWDVLMAKFALPASLVSGIDCESVALLPSSGFVYDLAGRKVGALDAESGMPQAGLAPGIYIANNKKFIVR